MRLAGKVAIVTGAGRGIGRGISLAFAREGARVVLAGRSHGPIEATAEEITAFGGEALAILCEVGDREQVAGMVARTIAAFGRVDVLVNNAQGWGPPGERSVVNPRVQPEDLPEEWWDHTFQTGVKATFHCCRAVFPHMKERGGKIINFGSPAGIVGSHEYTDYCANKEAIRGLTRALARSWGRYGINVNVICPFIETDALATADPAHLEDSLRRIPLGRIGEPERDAGGLAIFLASSDSDYLTGQTYVLDGGRTML